MNKFAIKNLSEKERFDWIRLSRSQNIGPSTFFNLLKIFGTPAKALDNVEDYSLKGGAKRPISLYDQNQVLKELDSCKKFGAQIIAFSENSYPHRLREISDPPPVLTVKGHLPFLQKNIISIVGPRNASINGCKFARMIANDLGKNNFVVASGLARGVDTASHQGSIDNGTIAVIAGGIDHIYPKENTNLYNNIASKGVLVSENLFNAIPRGGNFPQRNRIISGISLGVVVVEATLRSGTLTTAKFASQQNREIFAVPGSPFDPRCQGTNRLIKQGAKLIENVEDILEEIDQIISQDGQLQFMEEESDDSEIFSYRPPDDDLINEARELILSRIGYDPISPDEIIRILEIPTKVANIALMQLELANRIENKSGKVMLIRHC
jgi:DNA processing protein